MNAHGVQLRKRVGVYQWFDQSTSSVTAHPEALPACPLLSWQHAYQFVQRSPGGVPILWYRYYMIYGIGEGRRLERAINVPPSAADASATLLWNIGNSEYVCMRGRWVFIKCAFYESKPTADLHVAFPWNDTLVSKNKQPVSAHKKNEPKVRLHSQRFASSRLCTLPGDIFFDQFDYIVVHMLLEIDTADFHSKTRQRFQSI